MPSECTLIAVNGRRCGRNLSHHLLQTENSVIKLGVFMMSNMALSAIITLVVLPAVLATVGPPIHLGSLTLTGDVLCRQKVTQKM